jgi:hypothetical protein
MVFNGAPSIFAALNKDAAFGQVINFSGSDERTISLVATGVPSLTLPPIRVGTSETDAKDIETKDGMGKKIFMKFWYEEESKILRSKGINVDGQRVDQTRKILENGCLELVTTNTRADGTSCHFAAKLKKVSKLM